MVKSEAGREGEARWRAYLMADFHAIHALFQAAVRTEADGEELLGDTLEVEGLAAKEVRCHSYPWREIERKRGAYIEVDEARPNTTKEHRLRGGDDRVH